MKYTDRFFKFPVKLYLSRDVNERSDLEERLGIELPPSKEEEEEEPEYVMGWERIDVGDICGYGSIFSRNRTLEDVRRDGFDCTIVYLKYGKEVGCSWSPDHFEKKLNEFYSRYQSEMEEDIVRQQKVLSGNRNGFFSRLASVFSKRK